MVPTSSAPSFTPLGGSEVPPTHKRENINMSRFSSNENQTTHIHLPNKRSHGLHLTRTPEPPSVASPLVTREPGRSTHFQLDFHGTKFKWTIMAYNMAYNKILAQKIPPCV